MRRIFRIGVSVVLCVFLCATAVFAQSQPGTNYADAMKQYVRKIVITDASVDSTTTRVTIGGINFLGPDGGQLPTVLLRTTVLPLVSETDTQIVALLPAGLTPGAYLLIVANSPYDFGTFDLTIGATVPAVSPRPPRATGAPAPTRAPGAARRTGATGPPGVPRPN